MSAWVGDPVREERERQWLLDTGGCERPLIFEDTKTGERFAMRCRSRRRSRCHSCSRIYGRDVYRIARSGIEPAALSNGECVLWITLTPPGAQVFGSPSHVARRDGGKCRCGRRHQPHDQLLGVPLNASRFDYDKAALWNASMQERWRSTLDALYRCLLLTKRQRDGVQYYAAKEMQRRGLLHVHALVRCVLPGGVDAVAIRDALVGAAAVEGMSWGGECAVEILDPSDAQALHVRAGYCAKYLTKDTISDLPTHAQARRRHYARIAAAGVELLDEEARAKRRVRSRVFEQLGHGGTMYSRSHDWGLTLKLVRQERRKHIANPRTGSIQWSGDAGYHSVAVRDLARRMRDDAIPHEPSHESMFAVATDVGVHAASDPMPTADLAF